MTNQKNRDKTKIKIVYSPGTFGNCLRWLFFKFSGTPSLKNVDSPWDEDNRVHKTVYERDDTFLGGHYWQMHDEEIRMDGREKVVINWSPKDLLLAQRLAFYRTPGWDTASDRYKMIINEADPSFVKETFGSVSCSESVAKELLKIKLYSIETHEHYDAMKIFFTNKNYHQFDLHALWDEVKLKNELEKVSRRYNLNFVIEDKAVHNVVTKIKNIYPVATRNRGQEVLEAVGSNSNLDCTDLDILEQAYVEIELEKTHENLLFPYGTLWFKDTDQIKEYLNTYPAYLKHMNPRLAWHNGYKNPFYLTGKIDG